MRVWSITGQIGGKNTPATYRFVFERFAARFGNRKIADITSLALCHAWHTRSGSAAAIRRPLEPVS